MSSAQHVAQTIGNAQANPSPANIVAAINAMHSDLSAKIDGLDKRLSAKIDGVDNRISELRYDLESNAMLPPSEAAG